MDDEIESFERNDTFALALITDYKNLVGRKWVYSVKNNPENLIYKMCYIANSYSQIYVVAHFETFSPTPRWNLL